MGKFYRNYSKTSRTPRRPFEKERIDNELKLVGVYGLRNKREVWRVKYMLSRVRGVARTLLTLPERSPKRAFEGAALIRRLTRLGLLNESQQSLDDCLSLKVESFLDRRLQTRVAALSLAKTIHHSRVMIRQRHVRVGKRMVNVPSFMVRVESEKHIDYSATSPKGGGRPGRVMRKSLKSKKGGDGGDDAGEEEDM